MGCAFCGAVLRHDRSDGCTDSGTRASSEERQGYIRQKLYLPSSAHAEQYPGLRPVLARAIDWELIAQQYDELVKYAQEIQEGLSAYPGNAVPDPFSPHRMPYRSHPRCRPHPLPPDLPCVVSDRCCHQGCCLSIAYHVS